MTRTNDMRLIALCCLATITGSLLGQDRKTVSQTYNVVNPVNWDCASAIQLCSDAVFSFTASEGEVNSGCLYFFFVLDATTTISASAQATGDYLGFVPTTVPVVDMCGFGPWVPPTCSAANHLNYASLSGSYGPGVVFLLWNPNPDGAGTITINFPDNLPECETAPCSDCLPAFNPEVNDRYVISAWCKKSGLPQYTSNYNGPNGPYIKVLANGVEQLDIRPSGPIIDGWQRMEGEFNLPSGSANMDLKLGCGTGTALFDDVRFFPADASMKCMVYDSRNLRLDAELDERHYATFYEYDAEGKLARVKKETERGIMTIQETRYNASHLNP